MSTATASAVDDLTERQWELFEFLYNHARDHGSQPGYRGIGDRMGIRSPNTVLGHIRALIRKGWLEPADGEKRALRFLRRPDGLPFTGFADKPAGDAIDDLVDRWHAGEGAGAPLHEFLGMTPAEYARWAENRKP